MAAKYFQHVMYLLSRTSKHRGWYLQDRDGCILPDGMGFYLKISIFWPQSLYGKGFCFKNTSQSGDSTYTENKDKETFSLTPWDVQGIRGWDSSLGPGVTLMGSLVQGVGMQCGSVPALSTTPSRSCHQGMSMFYPWSTSISAATASSPACRRNLGQDKERLSEQLSHPSSAAHTVLWLSCDDKKPFQL